MTRTALVTGGSRGIGRATALALADDGLDVAITYRSSADAADAVVEEIAGRGRRAIAIQSDQSNTGQTAAAVDRTAQEFGGLDVVVLNAGVAEGRPLPDADDELYDHIMDTNVKGVFAAARAASHHLGEGGRIVVLGSINADVAFVPGMTLYATSKAAVQGMVRGLAHDFAAQGTTVNAVQPGPVDTDMNPADGPMAEMLTPMVALKRYGRAEEIAALVRFLASEESSYITGAALTIDGGVTV
ncbi:SDR family NAD(P)-dependent oxidoreductase [Euzebya tangerina]|uniref:SDR family NAD(P)-dependent oxidoreductase n=1 Tax=Euzebya tangerina TaxID=591198 RepID=UPI000E3189C2|nr:SDR family oxidoreductase [Euzebya tangerina]